LNIDDESTSPSPFDRIHCLIQCFSQTLSKARPKRSPPP
jgi:hypothetical protein